MSLFKVSVIIVTYNRLNLLKQSISKLLNQNAEIDFIYIINNNSNDNTKEYLNSLKSINIVPINLRKNLGGAGGFSYGLKYAYEHSNSDVFLIMDDDTMMLRNTIPKLLDKAKLLNGNFGFLSSNVKWWKNGNPSILNIPTVDKEWNKDIENDLVKIRSASFVSLLVSREAIFELGLPISEMFIWADDVEYTTRISERLPSYFVSDSIVIHKCATNSDNESVVNTDNHRILYYKCMFRNRLYIYRKYYNFKYFALKIIVYLSNLFVIPFKSKDHKCKRMIYTISGVWHGLFFNPKIRFPNDKI